MWRRVRYRKLQALALVFVAALVTVCACLGPLYQRAMEQALTTHTVREDDPADRTITLTSAAPVADLEATLPADIRRQMGTSSGAASVTITMATPKHVDAVGRLYAPQDACARVTVVQGHCPTGVDEVMVSSFELGVFGWRLGSAIPVTQVVDSFLPGKAKSHSLRVVGSYAPLRQEAIGAPVTGRAGFPSAPDSPTLATDDWVTTSATVNSSRWSQVSDTVAWPLRLGIDVDDLLALGPRVHAYALNPGSARTGHETAPSVRVESGIATLAATVARGRHQGRITVVALGLQLVVLALVVLWLLLGAATEQRRPEVALGRLRGLGAGGAARFLLAELTPLVLLGVVLGGGAAVGAVALVSRFVFPEPVPVETPVSFILAWGGIAAVAVLIVLAQVLSVVREPVSTLLRSVPPRMSARSAGAAELVLVTACLTAAVAFLTGALTGPLAIAAPTLLALAVGVVLGRLLTPLGTWLGGALLRRGRTAGGIALLQMVRRPATRRLLTLTLVAGCLLVFSADALAVAGRNRERAAEQAVGAPLVAQSPIDSFSAVSTVASVVRQLDPGRRLMTPVVTVTEPGAEQSPTVAVDPVAFARVALFPGADPGSYDWAAIEAPKSPALHLLGRRLTGSLSFDDVTFSGLSRNHGTAVLQLDLDVEGDNPATVNLGRLRPGSTTLPIHAAIPCHAGCDAIGLGVLTSPALAVTATIGLSGLHTSGVGTPSSDVDVGPAAEWLAGDDGNGASLTPSGARADSLRVALHTTGRTPPLLGRRWVPQVVPALVTGGTGPFTAPGIDGEDQRMRAVGSLPRVPGSPRDARVVDLQSLLRQGRIPSSDAILQVWFAHDDPALERRLVAALKARDVAVTYTGTVGQAREALEDTPAAWSLELAGVVGGASLLFGLLVLLVVVTTTLRARAADLAALRMSGVRTHVLRRVAGLEQVLVLVVGVVLGAACGALGARFALPSVRQFNNPPAVSTTDFAPPWAVVLVTSAGTLVLVGVLGWAAGRATARASRLSRLRDVQ